MKAIQPDAHARGGAHLIDLQQDSDRETLKYSISLENVPFWDALDNVCEAGHLSLQASGNNSGAWILNGRLNQVANIAQHRS